MLYGALSNALLHGFVVWMLVQELECLVNVSRVLEQYFFNYQFFFFCEGLDAKPSKRKVRFYLD